MNKKLNSYMIRYNDDSPKWLLISQKDVEGSTFYFVSLTLVQKFNALNSLDLDETLLMFACNLDRSVFGTRKARKKCLFIRAGVHETEGRFHAHAVIRKPRGTELNADDMRENVKKAWDKLEATGRAELLGRDYFQEVAPETLAVVMRYIVKDRYKLEADGLASVFNAKRSSLEQKLQCM